MNASRISRLRKSEIKRIVLIYAAFAGLWIVLSDEALHWLISDSSALHVAQTLKGWIFVIVTSLLLYLLLGRSAGCHDYPVESGQHVGLTNWKPWQHYLLAATVTCITSLVRVGIPISFGEHSLLILFMFPVILSAAFGGIGPGIFATVIALLSIISLGFPVTAGLDSVYSYELLQLGFFAANGLLVSILSMMLHEARHKSDLERNKAEASLTEKSQALQRLNAIAESSTDAIFIKDIEGRYLLFNQAAARFVGKSVPEVLGRDDTEIFPPDQAALIRKNDREVMQGNRVTTFQEALDTKDGKAFFLATKGPLHDGAGGLAGVFGISRYITGIKTTEFALRRERDINQRYLDAVQSLMVALDDEGRITMINRYACELLGYRERELIGENWFRTCLPKPEGTETILPMFRRIMAGDLTSMLQFENAVVCHDGSKRTISWRNNYFRNEAGNIVGTLSAGEDITERRKTEEALRESGETYRSLFEHMLNGFAYCQMLYVDGRPDDFIYLAVNAAFASQTGLQDVVGRKVSEVIPGIREADPELFERYERVASSGKPEEFEVFVQALDMWFAISVYSPKREYFVAVFDVITDRKKAEISLRQQTAELRQRNDELERFNRASVGRELDMIALKCQINELSVRCGQEPPYPLEFLKNPDASGRP